MNVYLGDVERSDDLRVPGAIMEADLPEELSFGSKLTFIGLGAKDEENLAGWLPVIVKETGAKMLLISQRGEPRLLKTFQRGLAGCRRADRADGPRQESARWQAALHPRARDRRGFCDLGRAA